MVLATHEPEGSKKASLALLQVLGAVQEVMTSKVDKSTGRFRTAVHRMQSIQNLAKLKKH